MYGCELCPYKLPRYVPMRLFALEYYRQLISSDLTHFHSTKKKAQLKFKDQLGPFVMNKKEGWQDADQILGEKYRLKRSLAFDWWSQELYERGCSRMETWLPFELAHSFQNRGELFQEKCWQKGGSKWANFIPICHTYHFCSNNCFSADKMSASGFCHQPNLGLGSPYQPKVVLPVPCGVHWEEWCSRQLEWPFWTSLCL